MKWWFSLCDKVVELFTGESNHGGSIKFRNRALGAWYLGWMVLAVGSAVACPINWVPAVFLLPAVYALIVN